LIFSAGIRTLIATVRFVSFLDILGFADYIERTLLSEALRIFGFVNEKILPTALKLGMLPLEGAATQTEKETPSLHVFSFSDTFVLVSADESLDSFCRIIAGTAILSRMLFAAGLPVRGAVTFGEAEFVSGTNHLIGRAIIRAARLEKAQNWFGIVLDSEILTPNLLGVLASPLIAPLTITYEVPFKEPAPLRNPCKVVNWRYGLEVEKGVQSLLPLSERAEDIQKRAETLKFARWLRNKGPVLFAEKFPKGTPVDAPWLSDMWVGDGAPGYPGSAHGDEF
jgi:hypothetical protein